MRHWVDRWGVEVGPSVVWIVVLVGYTLHGVGMAFFGVAFAVFALAVIDEVPRGRPEVDPEADPVIGPATGPSMGEVAPAQP